MRFREMVRLFAPAAPFLGLGGSQCLQGAGHKGHHGDQDDEIAYRNRVHSHTPDSGWVPPPRAGSSATAFYPTDPGQPLRTAPFGTDTILT
jgi:hypothetical protein